MPPSPQVTGAATQRALRSGFITANVRCPGEPCTTSATATIALPGARQSLKLVLTARTTPAGQTRRLRFVLSAAARRRLRAALRTRASLTAKLRISVRDLSRNTLVRRRSVRLTR